MLRKNNMEGKNKLSFYVSHRRGQHQFDQTFSKLITLSRIKLKHEIFIYPLDFKIHQNGIKYPQLNGWILVKKLKKQ